MISKVKCSEFHSGALSSFGKSEFPLKIMDLTNDYDPSRQSAMNSHMPPHQKTPCLAPKGNRTESQDANEQAHQLTRLQQDFIQTMVLQILQQQQADDAPVATTLQAHAHRQAVVRRVQSYVESHPQEVLTITQACAIAHVSRRTLQYSFETVLGISPLRFLRCQRLNQVRRALLAGDVEQTVMDTAACWGFWHAGQFARDYKVLFGESPSATLAQGRRQR